MQYSVLKQYLNTDFDCDILVTYTYLRVNTWRESRFVFCSNNSVNGPAVRTDDSAASGRPDDATLDVSQLCVMLLDAGSQPLNSPLSSRQLRAQTYHPVPQSVQLDLLALLHTSCNKR